MNANNSNINRVQTDYSNVLKWNYQQTFPLQITVISIKEWENK